jgi:hypothetical protein
MAYEPIKTLLSLKLRPCRAERFNLDVRDHLGMGHAIGRGNIMLITNHLGLLLGIALGLVAYALV